MNLQEFSNSKKTKKLRKNNINCKKLWNIFDNEIKSSDDIECVYDKNNKEILIN